MPITVSMFQGFKGPRIMGIMLGFQTKARNFTPLIMPISISIHAEQNHVPCQPSCAITKSHSGQLNLPLGFGEEKHSQKPIARVNAYKSTDFSVSKYQFLMTISGFRTYPQTRILIKKVTPLPEAPSVAACMNRRLINSLNEIN